MLQLSENYSAIQIWLPFSWHFLLPSLLKLTSAGMCEQAPQPQNSAST
jgi:hypothetical protein